MSQEFLNTIQQRFSLINVKRNQQETRKGGRKGKEPLLDHHNEIKIITSSDETFKLWKELIIKYSQGELLDVDATPICKIRLNPKWTPQRDGILSLEFFKWLGNCDEEDHKKLILHILGRSGESRVFDTLRLLSSRHPRCSRIVIVQRSGLSSASGRSSSRGSSIS